MSKLWTKDRVLIKKGVSIIVAKSDEMCDRDYQLQKAVTIKSNNDLKCNNCSAILLMDEASDLQFVKIYRFVFCKQQPQGVAFASLNLYVCSRKNNQLIDFFFSVKKKPSHFSFIYFWFIGIFLLTFFLLKWSSVVLQPKKYGLSHSESNASIHGANFSHFWPWKMLLHYFKSNSKTCFVVNHF